MSADNKSEQPTQRRRDKAREQGQIARSRELSSALAAFAALFVVAWQAQTIVVEWRILLRNTLDAAVTNDFPTHAPFLLWTCLAVLRWVVPAMAAAWTIALAVSLAQGGLVWAPAALAFKPSNLNPATRISQLFSSTAISSLLKSLVPFAIVLYVAVNILTREWTVVMNATTQSRSEFVRFAFASLFELAWKSSLVMLAWAGADYLFVRYKLENQLKMSHQEIREEHKESEGDPAVKARIRRLQRQTRRQKMLQDVEKAAVVITNPTHYAIALQYTAELAAPVVVAKGRDRLAEQIKQAARWHEIPMVENPPLAHALYRAVAVGQAIPSKLYVAVAEILAFVYRAQAKREGRR